MTNSIKQTKAALRTKMRSQLTAVSDEMRRSASVLACERLTTLDSFRNALVVMLYMPLESEIDITSAALRCFQQGKTICVPRVDWNKRDMDPVEITSFEDRMDVDEHGVRSPRYGRPVSPALMDLVVVPGLAFDAAGRRIGRGGGYYDRFLSHLRPDAVKIGLAFDQQMVDEVPVNEWDITMDGVVTDRRVTHVNATCTRD